MKLFFLIVLLPLLVFSSADPISFESIKEQVKKIQESQLRMTDKKDPESQNKAQDKNQPAISSDCTLQIQVDGIIGPGSVDYLKAAIEKASNWNCSSIFMTINTPGGNLESTRMMVEMILNSEKPFLCLVHPSGAHAGSAGAIILQACHVVGAMEATNIGAATPISGFGEKLDETLKNKIVNDTVSWVEGLAKLRGRNLQFARDIVTKAKSVDATEALKIGAIDCVVNKTGDFLEFSMDRVVKLPQGKSIKVVIGDVRTYEPGLRYEILQLLSDPQFAYLLFMGSLALLYFEITHPGMILPGVVGALGLVLSLVSFHKLNVWFGGLVLMLLGVIFMIAEAFVPSFGALGLGGVVSFILGSILLFDAEVTGYSLPLGTILPTAIGLGLFMFLLAYLAFNTRKVKKSAGEHLLIGQMGEVMNLNEDKKNGLILVQGELWKFESKDPVEMKQKLYVTSVRNLTLTVSSKKEEK